MPPPPKVMKTDGVATMIGNGRGGDIVGKNKARGQPNWPSRAELREEKGHGKGNRPRGGGSKAKWHTSYHQLRKLSRSHDDIIKILGPPPMSNDALNAIVRREQGVSQAASSSDAVRPSSSSDA